MKSILISIKPKYCELIASGKKTVEVRKTKPKLETPFKVYIYCTNGEPLMKTADNTCFRDNTYIEGENLYGLYELVNGKVIGEFVCDGIFPMSVWYSNPNDRLIHREYPFTCLTDKEIMDYLGNGVEGYGWHITDLVIYDKPKELSEFNYPPFRDCDIECRRCKYGFEVNTILGKEFDCDRTVKRPPQSWCYCEEVIEVKPLVEGKTIEIPRWRYEE
jgi:predicted transcriptional regulator